MKPENEKFWRPILGEVKGYLIGLKLCGIPLHQSLRKTTVLGFLATITSVISIYNVFVATKYIYYLATYRLCQYQIELTFNVVRSRGRKTNNPTACQLWAAYRQLLMKNDIKPQNTGNAIAQEDITIFLSVAVIQKRESVVNTAEILKRSGLAEPHNITCRDHNMQLPLRESLCPNSVKTLLYTPLSTCLAKLCKKLSCDGCKAVLVVNSRVVENCKLLQRKNGGGLIYPSQSLMKISMVAERCLWFVCDYAGDTLPQ